MSRKPRIITETVALLRDIATKAETNGILSREIGYTPEELRERAHNLDAYDARETRKDPTKRAKAKRKR